MLRLDLYFYLLHGLHARRIPLLLPSTAPTMSQVLPSSRGEFAFGLSGSSICRQQTKRSEGGCMYKEYWPSHRRVLPRTRTRFPSHRQRTRTRAPGGVDQPFPPTSQMPRACKEPFHHQRNPLLPCCPRCCFHHRQRHLANTTIPYPSTLDILLMCIFP